MKQISKAQPPSTRKMKLYLFCRNFITILLTIAVMIPFIYLLGSDESFYSQKPLYQAYAKNPYFQAKVLEVESALNCSLIVNIYSQQAHEKKQSSMKQWEHLREFVSYLGYYFNENGLITVDRLITPPEIKQQKKGKGTQNVDNQRLLENAYSLGNLGEMNFLRNKINKAATGILNRLKIKSKVSKNTNFGEGLKNKIVGEVLGNKVWLISIHPDFWQYHSSQELRKQLTTLSKQRQKDRFIVISIGPADPEWKKMKNISISLEETVISSMKDSFKDIITNYFSFQINATRVIQTILCQSQASLFQLNNFLHRCNTSFSCYNSIKIFRKEKVKKGEKNPVKSYVDQLCEQGQISQDDSDFIEILRDLGFIPIKDSGNEEIQNSLKVYYEIANGKKCKGNKRCNYEWLETRKPVNDIKVDQIEQAKPTIKDQEEEIIPVVEPTKPIKTKPQEKKPSTKPKKNEGKLSNKTTTPHAPVNESNENLTMKQVSKEQQEQKPSKSKSNGKDGKPKVTKSEDKFSASWSRKDQAKISKTKVSKTKVKKQVKTQPKGKKDNKPEVENSKEISENKDIETNKDQQPKNVASITNEQNGQIKDNKIASEILPERNENSAKEQVATAQKTEEPAGLDVQSEQATNNQPQNDHFDVAEIPCDNQKDKICQSTPSDNEEQAAKYIQIQTAIPIDQSQNKQIATQETLLISQETLSTNENPSIQLQKERIIEEVPEDKEIVTNIEESSAQTIQEVQQIAAELLAESPESTEEIIEVTDQASNGIQQSPQNAQNVQSAQKTQSTDTPPAINDQDQ